MSKQYNVAILGATGAVGTRMIEQLAQSTIPVKHVKLLESKKSAGKTLQFTGEVLTNRDATKEEIQSILNQLSHECGGCGGHCGGCGGDDCGEDHECGGGCGHCH